MLGALLARARGRAVLFITHSPEEAALADEVLLMDAGRIVDRGRPEYLAGRPGPFRELMWSSGISPAAF